jgi:hypothetical protein
MSKDGLTLEEIAAIDRVNEIKISRSTTNNQLLQHEDDSLCQIEPTEHLDLLDESKVILFSLSFKY